MFALLLLGFFCFHQTCASVIPGHTDEAAYNALLKFIQAAKSLPSLEPRGSPYSPLAIAERIKASDKWIALEAAMEAKKRK